MALCKKHPTGLTSPVTYHFATELLYCWTHIVSVTSIIIIITDVELFFVVCIGLSFAET